MSSKEQFMVFVLAWENLMFIVNKDDVKATKAKPILPQISKMASFATINDGF